MRLTRVIAASMVILRSGPTWCMMAAARATSSADESEPYQYQTFDASSLPPRSSARRRRGGANGLRPELHRLAVDARRSGNSGLASCRMARGTCRRAVPGFDCCDPLARHSTWSRGSGGSFGWRPARCGDGGLGTVERSRIANAPGWPRRLDAVAPDGSRCLLLRHFNRIGAFQATRLRDSIAVAIAAFARARSAPCAGGSYRTRRYR